MVFHWSLSDSKSLQVSRTLLSILNNAVVWMVSTFPSTSKSSSPFNSPLVTVQKAPITLDITVTIMFLSFFFSILKQGRATYSSFHFLSVLFCGQPGQQSRQFCKFSFFLLIIIRSGLLAGILWSVCMSMFHRSLCVSFSWTDAGLGIYHLFIWSSLDFLHISLCITLPTKSCLVLYSFWPNLLHSLIKWMMVSSLSPHSRHLLFCCVLRILILIWLVLMALFCAAIRKDFVSLFKFPFLSHVQVFSCEMLFISRLKRIWSCFSSHFCFLVIVILLAIVLSESYLMAVISPPSCFSM